MSSISREVKQAQQRPDARRRMTHPGVGLITALATEVFRGDPARFADSKALARYISMIPSEHSSGGRQRLRAMILTVDYGLAPRIHGSSRSSLLLRNP
jgi:transposase